MASEKERLNALVKTTAALLGENKEVAKLRQKVKTREQQELAQASSRAIGDTAPDDET